jgi:membrane protease YdiL (CAAX protease family)
MRYRELKQRLPELHLLLLLVLLEAVGIGAMLAVQHFGVDARGRLGVGAYLGLLGFQAAMCAATVLWARATDGWTWGLFRLEPPVLPKLGLGLMAGTGVALGMLAFQLLVLERGLEPALSGESLLAALGWAVPSWLVLVPLVVLKDELLFRGYVFTRLGRARSATYGMWVSSLLFALIQSVEQQPGLWGFLGLFATGIYVCWLAVRTGSLWVAVGARGVMALGEVLLGGTPQLGGLWKYATEDGGGAGGTLAFMALLALSGKLVSVAMRGREASLEPAPRG